MTFFISNMQEISNFITFVGPILGAIFYSHRILHQDLKEVKEDCKRAHQRIDETNKNLNERIDQTNKNLNERIDQTNKKIDQTNQRIDQSYKIIIEMLRKNEKT